MSANLDVIPAQAGIQLPFQQMDSRFRGSDAGKVVA